MKLEREPGNNQSVYKEGTERYRIKVNYLKNNALFENAECTP